MSSALPSQRSSATESQDALGSPARDPRGVNDVLPEIAVQPAEAKALAAIARRQLAWDHRAPARIVTTPRALGVYTTPPLDVLVFTAVPAVVEGPEVDRVVSLSSLVTELDRAANEGGVVRLEAMGEARVPITSATNVALLPPADDWQIPMHAVSGDLASRVDDAVAEFDRRGKGLGEGQQQAIADEIWGRVAWAGIPMRTLHAARRLGMLANDRARVSAATNGEWRRLSTPRGQVFTRMQARTPLRLVR